MKHEYCSDAGNNLAALARRLTEMQKESPEYPEWADNDSDSTMSDNKGGIIIF